MSDDSLRGAERQQSLRGAERQHSLRGAERQQRPDRRSDARERALYVLYEAAQKSVAPTEVLAAQVVPADELTTTLVTGVETHRERLDEAIAAKAAAAGWTLKRMPLLDLNVLRLGVFELTERPDVPVAVVIDEAVELAKRFSTDHSGRFVNGVLAALATELRPTASGPETP
jgi:N utilization substance protein B